MLFCLFEVSLKKFHITYFWQERNKNKTSELEILLRCCCCCCYFYGLFVCSLFVVCLFVVFSFFWGYFLNFCFKIFNILMKITEDQKTAKISLDSIKLN